MAGTRPNGVGILAMDIYFPSTYVKQSTLEAFDGVSEGKYTIGLGQEAMAVCGDREDINSAALTVTQSLLDKYGISPKDVGRLEVGTETLIDKSKAVKTTLMQLFESEGNYDIEGIDSKNACYGGTAALLNSLAWVESSAWDGRYAVVVAGDIAVYEPGPARPTGGAGVLAMLVGPDAPMVVEPGLRGSHMEDVYDFYKPTMVSEYPRVDGQLSNACYLRALDGCYNRYGDRFEKAFGTPFSLDSADYSVFHAPYNKLVQKSFGRYLYNDYKRGTGGEGLDFEQFDGLTADETYTNRDFLKHLVNVSKEHYKRMVMPSELITKQCGNSYCGSTYAGLLSLVSNEAANLEDKRAMLFSYGSGLAATQFSIKFEKSVEDIAAKADVANRLAARTEVTPEEFTRLLEVREKNYTMFDYVPEEPVSSVLPGTYYLAGVDHLERRTYARALHTAAAPAAQALPRRVAAAVRPVQRGPTLAAPMIRLARRLGRL
mmetsp:Transcript_36292/g.95077  ORF Transcript_36292/g.95077 Transcript_36292/m.95077 type:complete len:488 (-) Transcript_36292:105-1568(-)